MQNIKQHPLSLNNKYWQKASDYPQIATHLIQTLALPELLARLLAQKQLAPEETSQFLTPKIRELLPNPSHLLDMDKAVERSIKAITNKEKIYVFGDYDVDGATSSSLLKRFFLMLGVEISIYIPDRIKEGYGPTPDAMRTIRSNGADIVITVDCGATSYDAIDAANDVGLDVIILDHHIGGETLPNACAIVNPNRLDQQTEYTQLAAVGVCFLFCVALQKKLQEQNLLLDTQSPNLLALLDLVALGTVCDVMPLTGLNRAFVTQGLKVINKRNNIGLKTLSDVCGINDPISCYHLGFVLGPRINAGGRVGQSDLGAKLLSSHDNALCLQISNALNNFNHERQMIEAEILCEAEMLAYDQRNNNIICIANNGWHQGVIGIVASRIKEKFNKPTIVISFDENGIGKASCRSVKGFNLGELIIAAKAKDLLVAGGGHAMAAGLTIMRSKLEEFCEYIENKTASHDFSMANVEEYNAELSLDAINLTLAHEIQRLAPFGPKNPEPIFYIHNISFKNTKIINEKHFSAQLVSSYNSNSSSSVKCIAFNMANNENMKKITQPDLSVIASLKINLWGGRETAQLIIKDIIM